MKTVSGYNLYKNEDGCYEYYLHEYIVDACNVEGEPSQGLWTIEDSISVPTKQEAITLMRKWCKYYDKVTIYDQYVEADINRYGGISTGDVVRQKISDYVKGTLIKKCSCI